MDVAEAGRLPAARAVVGRVNPARGRGRGHTADRSAAAPPGNAVAGARAYLSVSSQGVAWVVSGVAAFDQSGRRQRDEAALR